MGQQRDNRSRDTGLLSTWPAEGPPLAWRVDGLGDGIASLALADGRIFTTTTYGESEYAVALDEVIRATTLGCASRSGGQRKPAHAWLSQRTPTSTATASSCLPTAAGSFVSRPRAAPKVWRVSYPHEFGTKQGKWGFCDRPLVDGDKLICTTGGSKATLAPLDKRHGQDDLDQAPGKS